MNQESMDNNAGEQPTYGAETVEMNSFSRLVGIIFSPVKTMQAIKEKPTLLWIMLLLCVLPVVSLVLMWPTYETSMTLQLEQQMQNMNVELTGDMMELQLTISKVTLLIGSLSGMLISGLVTATYYFVCAKIAKSDVGFKQMLSVSYHILIVSLISTVLMTVLTLAGVEVNTSVQMTSLASFLPESMTGSFFFGVAMVIEVFKIWRLVLMYFALRYVARISKKASAISVLIAFILNILVSGGSLMLASLFVNIRG